MVFESIGSLLNQFEDIIGSLFIYAQTPNWLGNAVLGAILASIGYIITQIIEWWFRVQDEQKIRKAQLSKLYSLLLAGNYAFNIQNRTALELYGKLEGKENEEIKKKKGFDGVFAANYPFVKIAENEGYEKYEKIRSITENTIMPLNKDLQNWLKEDNYFRGQWNNLGIYCKLAAELEILEAHLRLWNAKYESLMSENRHSIVYLDDETTFGVAFPQHLAETVKTILAEKSFIKRSYLSILKHNWYYIGNIQFWLNHKEDALNSYEKAISLDKEFANAWYMKGKVLFDANDFLNTIDAYKNAAKIWGNKRNYEKYEKSTNAIINFNPKNLDIFIERGNTFLKMRRYPEALESFNRAMELNPKPKKLKDLIYKKGNTLASMGNYEEATEIYDRAIEDIEKEITENESTQKEIIQKEVKGKAEELKLKNLRVQLMALNRLKIQFLHNRSDAIFKSQKYEKALESYDETFEAYGQISEKKKPDYSQLVALSYCRGMALRRLGRNEDAEKAITSAFEFTAKAKENDSK
jgi:tetratricopeptide (TPR) repeat protein